MGYSNRHSGFIALLPFMEQGAMYDQIKLGDATWAVRTDCLEWLGALECGSRNAPVSLRPVDEQYLLGQLRLLGR